MPLIITVGESKIFIIIYFKISYHSNAVDWNYKIENIFSEIVDKRALRVPKTGREIQFRGRCF
jgi:hypothetical protein